MLAVPQEPWTAAHETKVAVGPKGMIIGGIICYDGEYRPSALAAASAWLMSRWIHAMIGHPNGSSRSLVLHVSPGDFPEIVRDTVFKGAELVVRIQGAPSSSFYYVYFLSDYCVAYDAVRPSLSVAAATIVCILNTISFWCV